MSDLDKMMYKLKNTKKKKVEETPTEDPIEEDDDEAEDEEEETPKGTHKEETPKEEEQEVNIEQEIAILQNEGIFRREIIGAMRELINVQKVNTQALIDLNKLIGGLANGK